MSVGPGAVVPPGVVTVTYTAPGDPAGTTAVTTVPARLDVTCVAGTAPKVTEVAPDRAAPTILIFLPPAAGPTAGVIESIEGPT